MMYSPFSFDGLCATYMQAVRSTLSAYVTTFNFLDPFKLVRASSKLQEDFFKLAP